MNIQNDVRPGGDEILIASFESRAAEVCSGEMTLLQHRTHRSIEHKYTASERVFEGLPANAPILHRKLFGRTGIHRYKLLVYRRDRFGQLSLR